MEDNVAQDIDEIRTLNNVKNAFHEMTEGLWEDAINSISELEDEGINSKLYMSNSAEDRAPSWTFLSYAVSLRRTDVIRLLIRKGADVNMHSERMFEDNRLVKFTPFELAVEMDYFEACQLLVENGANLFLQSSNPIGMILKNAILNGNADIVKLILKNRYYVPGIVSKYISSVVTKIRDESVRSEMTELLQIYLMSGKTESTPLIKTLLLILNSSEEEAVTFIEEHKLDELQKKDLNSISKPSDNILTFATRLNKLKVVKVLLEKGFDVNRRKDPGEPGYALVIAVKKNFYDMCKLLLKWGAIVEQIPQSLCTKSIFTYAFKNGNSDILSLLVQHLEDPKSAFTFFIFNAYDEIRHEDVMNTFSVELLSAILYKSSIPTDTWLSWMICRETYPENGRSIFRNKKYLLELLVNYFPSGSTALQAAVRALCKSDSGESIRTLELKMLVRRALTCPSLQNLCRFGIRQAVQPFTEANVHSLRMPELIENYLFEHPLKDICERG